MNHYDTYNREERAICAHLFRLLHEQLHLKEMSPLGQFLNLLSKAKLKYTNGTPDFSSLKYNNVAIYCEAAIIRDAYYNSKTKPNVNDFMDKLTKLLMKQEEVVECTLYSQLPSALNDIRSTHPKQIRQKAEEKGISLTEGEKKVYGAMQGMFNAKPDLVITIDNLLLVCEAKFTEKFDDNQISRTRKIAEVWAELLYESFGFTEKPIYTVFKMGAAKSYPDINWEEVLEIAERTYPEGDRTRIAIRSGVEIINTKLDYSGTVGTDSKRVSLEAVTGSEAVSRTITEVASGYTRTGDTAGNTTTSKLWASSVELSDTRQNKKESDLKIL